MFTKTFKMQILLYKSKCKIYDKASTMIATNKLLFYIIEKCRYSAA